MNPRREQQFPTRPEDQQFRFERSVVDRCNQLAAQNDRLVTWIWVLAFTAIGASALAIAEAVMFFRSPL